MRGVLVANARMTRLGGGRLAVFAGTGVARGMQLAAQLGLLDAARVIPEVGNGAGAVEVHALHSRNLGEIPLQVRELGTVIAILEGDFQNSGQAGTASGMAMVGLVWSGHFFTAFPPWCV